jgi:hypothetical protein
MTFPSKIVVPHIQYFSFFCFKCNCWTLSFISIETRLSTVVIKLTMKKKDNTILNT